MSITLSAGVQVAVDAPPVPAVTTPAELTTVVDAPSSDVSLTAPSTAPSIADAPASQELIVPIAGPTGPAGPSGPSGTDPDLPDLTLLFENGLI